MILKLVFVAFLSLTTIVGYTQDSQEYQVRNLKFKKGMHDEAMAIGMKYLNAANLAVGIEVRVYRFYSGPWDVQIMVPILPHSSLSEVVFGYGNKSSEVWQEMVRIGGSEEKVVAEIKKYHQTILNEEVSYAKIVESKE